MPIPRDFLHDHVDHIISVAEMMVEAKGHAVMNPAGNEGVLDGGKDLLRVGTIWAWD